MKEENRLEKNKARWFAVYTKSRAEKKVAEQIAKYGYNVYLPLKKEVRQWKDRLKKVEVPLFNSYVFVKVDDKEYYEIPKLINGFVKYVTIGGQRVAVREKEISAIKKMLDFSAENIDVSNEEYKINQRVKISSGKLKGFEGKLVEFRGKAKIAIRIDSLKMNLLIEINKNSIKTA